MRSIPTLPSSFACSLLARSAKQGPTIFTEDGTDGPKPINTDAYSDTAGGGGGGGWGTGANSLSMGTQTGKDPPFMLPLITGGFILALLCAMWYGWRWYDRRGRSNGEVEQERTSTRMNAAPPKLWEVEIKINPHVGPIPRVSMEDEEEEPLKVRKSVLRIDWKDLKD